MLTLGLVNFGKGVPPVLVTLNLSPLTWQAERGPLTVSSAMTGRPQHSHPVPSESCIQLFFPTLECLWGPLVSNLILGGLPWSPVCSLLPGLPRFFILDSDSCSASLLNCSPKDVPSCNAQLGSTGCRDPETTVQHQPRAPSLLLSEKALDTDVP